eukprot:5645182-Pyramimonas_sp.AAC.1
MLQLAGFRQVLAYEQCTPPAVSRELKEPPQPSDHPIDGPASASGLVEGACGISTAQPSYMIQYLTTAREQQVASKGSNAAQGDASGSSAPALFGLGSGAPATAPALFGFGS